MCVINSGLNFIVSYVKLNILFINSTISNKQTKMLNKFLVLLVVVLVLFSCGAEGKLRAEDRSTMEMEDFMAKWAVSGSQDLGQTCNFWKGLWCGQGMICSGGKCVWE